MKKLMFAISLAGMMAMGASAAVESANTFGVLKVESDQAQTIICVPWVKVGAGTAIPVADLVMTSNLTVGDWLYYYDNSASGDAKYKAWELVAGTTEGSKVWAAPKMVTKIGVTTTGDPASVLTAARGDALILVRQNVDAPIYLYGQYIADTTTPSQTMVAGAWNLVAPPNKLSVTADLNTDFTWASVADNDTIRLQNNGIAITLVRNDNKWAYKAGSNYYPAAAKVQPGQGFWYVSTGNTDPSVTFGVSQ